MDALSWFFLIVALAVAVGIIALLATLIFLKPFDKEDDA